MNNYEKELEHLIVAIIKKLNRNNKQELKKLINITKLEPDTLKVVISILMPSYEECQNLATEEFYNDAIQLITSSIYIARNPDLFEEKKCLEYAFKTTALIIASIKKDRKATEDLYVKSVKTNLTQAEYDKLQHLRKSLNYSSIAAFIRDAAIQALDVKPQQDNTFKQYFEETSKLSKAIRDIAENLDDKQSTNELHAQLKALKKQIDSTRKLAVDSHSSVTAKILAKKHLSARQLEILLKEKLEEEKNQ